jgi:16S rRNA (guanine527-N7)-methyltransferase
MVSEARLRQLLEPFGVNLISRQLGQVSIYLNLLLRWNRRINLTSVRDPESCVTRHFGESLYLARWISLDGKLLDVGTGAGFPGLSLKIIAPNLDVTLLEPNGKKRAFLKEVTRACEMQRVTVISERMEAFAQSIGEARFQIVTARAVGQLPRLVPFATQSLEPRGILALWVTESQAGELAAVRESILWENKVRLPLSKQRMIWLGKRQISVS